MALKQSKLAELLEELAGLMLDEVKAARGAEGIPLSASDKAVALALLRHNNITAEPDSEKISGLREAFADDLAKKREARARALLDHATSDGLGGLMN